ncbi:MAG: hypothetical protein ACLQPD_35875 [Desulfomonilaceae bacterium]
MDNSNGAVLGLPGWKLPRFTPLLALWSEGWRIRALCLTALGFWILFVVGLIMWTDPSVNLDQVVSQIRLELFDL